MPCCDATVEVSAPISNYSLSLPLGKFSNLLMDKLIDFGYVPLGTTQLKRAGVTNLPDIEEFHYFIVPFLVCLPMNDQLM